MKTRHAASVCDTHLDEKAFTYRANANRSEIKSRLDRIYVTSRLTNFTFDGIITPSLVPTDHWLVVVKYAPKEAPEIGKGQWTLPLHLLENNKFMERIITCGIRLQDDIENANQETLRACMANFLKRPRSHETETEVARDEKNKNEIIYQTLFSRPKLESILCITPSDKA